MKLFTKYNRINLLSTIIIFIAGSVAFTILLRYVIINQVDEDLMIEKNEINFYINRFHHFPAVIEVDDQYISYHKINKPANNSFKVYTNEIYNKVKEENELRRTIAFTVIVNKDWYFVSVSKSLEGTDELIQTIIVITLILILLILAATFIINRIILKKLWQPFYSTLGTIKNFSLNNRQKVNFSFTKIDEFSYLNSTLKYVLHKAGNDYQSLKEFTENASHELQTPLAVIQSKLDIIIQNEKLSETESHAIQSAYNAVQGLSRLNQSLLLLAKIENKQFSEQTTIDVKELMQNKINQFAELWKSRNIVTQINLSDKTVTGNNYLIEILLNNVLSNATKHNIFNGSIAILLNNDLQITNTGVNYGLDEKLLYKRFSKQNNSSDNHGLGLSIIQQICEVSNYICTYKFQLPDFHSFLIKFNDVKNER